MKQTSDIVATTPTSVSADALPYSAVADFMSGFPLGVLATRLAEGAETPTKHLTYRCSKHDPATADEYGRTRIVHCRVTVEMACMEGFKADTTPSPKCESPEFGEEIGAFNPDAYYCKSCKLIHEK